MAAETHDKNLDQKNGSVLMMISSGKLPKNFIFIIFLYYKALTMLEFDPLPCPFGLLCKCSNEMALGDVCACSLVLIEGTSDRTGSKSVSFDDKLLSSSVGSSCTSAVTIECTNTGEEVLGLGSGEFGDFVGVPSSPSP